MKPILKSIAAVAMMTGTPNLAKADAIGDGGMALAVAVICDVYANDQAMDQVIVRAAIETGIDDVAAIKEMMIQSGKVEITRARAKLTDQGMMRTWCNMMRAAYISRNILEEQP